MLLLHGVLFPRAGAIPLALLVVNLCKSVIISNRTIFSEKTYAKKQGTFDMVQISPAANLARIVSSLLMFMLL